MWGGWCPWRPSTLWGGVDRVTHSPQQGPSGTQTLVDVGEAEQGVSEAPRRSRPSPLQGPADSGAPEGKLGGLGLGLARYCPGHFPNRSLFISQKNPLW